MFVIRLFKQIIKKKIIILRGIFLVVVLIVGDIVGGIKTCFDEVILIMMNMICVSV